MNNGQQIPPIPQQGQPMTQYPQQPVQKKGRGCFRYTLYGILALFMIIIIGGIMRANRVTEQKKTQATRDSVFIDQADSLLRAASVKDFGLYLQKLQVVSLGASKDENKQLVANNGIRAGKLLDSKEAEWRKLYVEKLKNELWEHNVEIEINGKTITFISGMFANNSNIKQFQGSAASTLTILGFKQVRYKWIKHADEYQYFDL